MNSPANRYANEQAKQELRRISARYAGSRDTAVRHKCFISYHGANATEVLSFVKRYEHVLIPRVIGVTDDDPRIASDDIDYVMDTIREKYLSDSTVTILMVGNCTWARKFIDWEIYSSLRRDKVNRLNGLMGIELPSAAQAGITLQSRFSDNLPKKSGEDGYARYWKYPRTDQALRDCIHDAFEARRKRDHLIRNTRQRRQRDSPCP
ncbi:TIR domain-containing protein [Streptomyces qaidamensis]|uniref:TIR domain-containing protein n=1 Tax=Streptomyces qaidamensis TaxID=1783515 RepID=UPI001F43481E|nr:TIR domain-containing protein [Streptomyces qaidamensis]